MTIMSAEYMRRYRIQHSHAGRYQSQRRNLPKRLLCDCGQPATWVATVRLLTADSNELHTSINLCDVCNLETQDEAEPAIVHIALSAADLHELFECAVDAQMPKRLIEALCAGRLVVRAGGCDHEGHSPESARVKS